MKEKERKKTGEGVISQDVAHEHTRERYALLLIQVVLFVIFLLFVFTWNLSLGEARPVVFPSPSLPLPPVDTAQLP